MRGSLFQFIQWSDDEPYNIAELIAEYEQNLEFKYPVYNDPKYNDMLQRLNESEETEVNKNKRWALKEVKETISGFFDKSTEGVARHYEDELIASIADIINQLDEPEVLSQEWISDNAVVGQYPDGMGYVVPAYKLQNLLVPKQEELEAKIQELIETYKQEDGQYSNPENGWIGGIIEDLKNLVEEEQKYVVPVSENHALCSFANDVWGVYKEDTDKLYLDDDFKFTEQEIKDYDERYWPFAVKVEELEE